MPAALPPGGRSASPERGKRDRAEDAPGNNRRHANISAPNRAWGLSEGMGNREQESAVQVREGIKKGNP